jgi:hypothetical protein
MILERPSQMIRIARAGWLQMCAVSAAFAICTLGCGAPKTTVFFGGDVASVGSQVYVDGVRVGVLRPKEHDASESTVTDSSDSAQQFECRLSVGPHQVLVVTLLGDTLRATLHAHESAGMMVAARERRLYQ